MSHAALQMVNDVVAVHEFFSKIEPIPLRTDMQSIGLMRDGKLIAGVLYDSFNRHNINMHVAALPGVIWLRPLFLKTIFGYPFIQCGVKRITGLVRETNLAARKLDEHVGFTEETRLKGAAEDGSDLIVYVMWRDQCRYIAQ